MRTSRCVGLCDAILLKFNGMQNNFFTIHAVHVEWNHKEENASFCNYKGEFQRRQPFILLIKLHHKDINSKVCIAHRPTKNCIIKVPQKSIYILPTSHNPHYSVINPHLTFTWRNCRNLQLLLILIKAIIILKPQNIGIPYEGRTMPCCVIPGLSRHDHGLLPPNTSVRGPNLPPKKFVFTHRSVERTRLNSQDTLPKADLPFLHVHT